MNEQMGNEWMDGMIERWMHVWKGEIDVLKDGDIDG